MGGVIRLSGAVSLFSSVWAVWSAGADVGIGPGDANVFVRHREAVSFLVLLSSSSTISSVHDVVLGRTRGGLVGCRWRRSPDLARTGQGRHCGLHGLDVITLEDFLDSVDQLDGLAGASRDLVGLVRQAASPSVDGPCSTWLRVSASSRRFLSSAVALRPRAPCGRCPPWAGGTASDGHRLLPCRCRRPSRRRGRCRSRRCQ